MSAHDLAESSLLGALLLEGDRIATAFEHGLAPQHFTSRPYQCLYRAMLTAFDRRLPLEPAALRSILNEQGNSELVPSELMLELVAGVTSAAHLSHHAGIVLRAARVRDLMTLARRMLDELPAIDLTSDTQLAQSIETLQAKADAALAPLAVQAPSVIESVCLADVPEQQVEWLWKPYLPLRLLTILEGDGGLGKTWIALAAAAAVTAGLPLVGQDGYPGEPLIPRSVVFMTAEDGLGETVLPRIRSLRGDPSRIQCVTGLRKGSQVLTFTLADIPALDALLELHKPGLLIIDPIQAFLGADVDMSKANETRPVLFALARLAEKHNLAIILIRHWIKGQGKASAKGMGGMDFYAAARSVLVVGEDPEDPSKRILSQAKMNLAERGKSHGFQIRNDPDTNQGLFYWLGLHSASANDLAIAVPRESSEGQALARAVDLLRRALLDGPKPAKEVRSDLAEQSVPRRTLERAQTKLGVASIRIGGIWHLSLPGTGSTVEYVS